MPGLLRKPHMEMAQARDTGRQHSAHEIRVAIRNRTGMVKVLSTAESARTCQASSPLQPPVQQQVVEADAGRSLSASET